ncbi:MAG: hypothetical protein EOO65_02725 [Methanosarcinales archaeon]|nr:MAG: hypothetical protein EOO65_02725 [Methanosarcinales archaeon]
MEFLSNFKCTQSPHDERLHGAAVARLSDSSQIMRGAEEVGSSILPEVTFLFATIDIVCAHCAPWRSAHL